jgi:hypothetical protein
MTASIRKHLPLGIWLIASFYVFGALVILIALFIDGSNVREVIAAAHGLSPVIGAEFVLAIAALALILAYGLVSLSRWGFFLAIAYSVFLCANSLVQGGLSFAWTGQPQLQVAFGNLLWSAAVLIYLLVVRQRFFAPASAEPSLRSKPL